MEINERKLEELKRLEEKVKKLSEKERTKFFGKFFVGVISALMKRLIRYEGYSVTKSILKREVTEIGKRDAKNIMKIFGIKEKNPENVSRSLKLAALVLGFKLEVIGDETYVKECPFAVMAKETNEPLLTEICDWYCNGMVREIVGEEYFWEGFHNINKEVPECYYKAVKR